MARNLEADVESLHKIFADAVFSAKTQPVVEILCKYKRTELLQLSQLYLDKFATGLEAAIIAKTTGELENGLMGLFLDAAHYDAKVLHDACEGAGTDEQRCIEVLCTRTDAELKAICEAYQADFKEDLKTRMASEVGGNLGLVFQRLLAGGRRAGSNAEQDADALYNAGEGKLGTDEKFFINFLTSHSPEYIGDVAVAYRRNTKKKNTLTKAIQDEFGGDLEDALVALAMPLNEYLGQQALKALRSKDKPYLVRLFVSRREASAVDLSEISLYLNRGTNKGLMQWLVEKFHGGDAGKFLVEIAENFVKSPQALEAQRKAVEDARVAAEQAALARAIAEAQAKATAELQAALAAAQDEAARIKAQHDADLARLAREEEERKAQAAAEAEAKRRAEAEAEARRRADEAQLLVQAFQQAEEAREKQEEAHRAELARLEAENARRLAELLRQQQAAPVVQDYNTPSWTLKRHYEGHLFTLVQALPRPIKAVRATVTWRDQGWGNRKGTLFLVLLRGNANGAIVEVARENLFGVAPHDNTQQTIDGKTGPGSVIAAAHANDRLELHVFVGQGGGHELTIQACSFHVTY